MRFSCVDSFCGAGGLSLGLASVEFEVLFSFDIDSKCIETIKRNPKYFKHPAVCEDIKNMLGGRLLETVGLKQGELFLLAGGPPCQGFSIQRIGEDADSRNELVLLYGELIKEVRPLYFLMENVSGIQGKRGKVILDELIEKTESIGYHIHKQLIDAEDYGVPQRRKRIILVGERVDIDSTYEFPKPTGERRTVRDTIEFLPPPPEDGKPHPNYPLHRRDRLSEKNIQRINALAQGQGRDFLPEELLADCHRIDSAIIGHRNVYGRMAWDDVAPTITARFDSFTRGLFGHPDQPRSISLLEGALLQTFPLDFEFAGSKIEIARQIGNAVPPKLAKAIGESIIAYYTGKR
ncbi:MAG: DNA cytosine methyltransferase [Firmicutes bacterium]|nr:DNA cytosine methyltransferase [Bacillota bacterium]MCL5993043.1 DNA cytosine methyltransferase [Bacillota bacterium]